MRCRARVTLLLTAVLIALCVPGRAGPAPTITRHVEQMTPTHTEPLRFLVVFSEPVLGLDSTDIVTSCAATVHLEELPPGDGTTYAAAVSDVASDGSVCLSIQGGAATGWDGTPSDASEGGDPCVALDRLPPPPPSQVAPAEDAATSDLSPKFSWTVPSDASGIAKYEIEIRGPKTRDYVTPRTYYTPSLDVEGDFTWRVNCFDLAGNVGEWTPWRTLALDATAPTAPLLESSSLPTGTWIRSGSIESTFTPSTDAGSGIEGYEVLWNHDPISTGSGPANRGPSWNEEVFAVPQDGEWWCHAAGLDRAENRSATTHVGPFWIDITPPVLCGVAGSIRLPNDAGRLSATADWSAITAADACDPSPSLSFSVPSGSPLPMGGSTVRITAEDHVGNVSVRDVPVFVYNTQPPVVRIVRPADGERVFLGESRTPSWDVVSLAPIASIETEGLVRGFLDTLTPGRHAFSVSVVDSTGLTEGARAECVVLYADRRLEVVRVRPDGTEEALSPLATAGRDSFEATLEASEWLRVRCTVDEVLAALPRSPVTFSLVRTDPARPDLPILERVGVLAEAAAGYSLDLPLIVFRPGFYTLWLGFVDETSTSFEFELVR